MKSIVIYIALLVSVSSYASGNTNGGAISNQSQFDIYEAHNKAKRLNKPIFYVVASANCPHCVKYLEKTIRPNFEKLNRDFVFALSDLTKGDKVPSNIPFKGTTPTTFILAPNGQLITEPIEGNFNADYLNKILNKLYQAYSQ